MLSFRVLKINVEASRHYKMQENMYTISAALRKAFYNVMYDMYNVL